MCRGCKRFAHEITAWNGYDADQRAQVWQRLLGLRDEVTQHRLQVADQNDLTAVALVAKLDHLSGAQQLHAVLAYLVQKNWSLAKAGLSCDAQWCASEDPLSVMQTLDAEIYTRSKAHYERNFKTTV